MRTPSRGLALLASVALLVMLAPAGSLQADDLRGGPADSYVNGALRKAGRGIANLATCWAELLRVTSLVNRQDGYVAASTFGVLKGVARTFFRALAGAYEIATFPLEIPNNFEPIMQPEFVFAHGDWVE